MRAAEAYLPDRQVFEGADFFSIQQDVSASGGDEGFVAEGCQAVRRAEAFGMVVPAESWGASFSPFRSYHQIPETCQNAAAYRPSTRPGII